MEQKSVNQVYKKLKITIINMFKKIQKNIVKMKHDQAIIKKTASNSEYKDMV